MTKVTGPVLSVSARGSLSKKITFQKTPSGHKVYLDHSHKGMVSPIQAGQRSKFLSCIQEWGSLSETQKEEWEDASRGFQMTGYNYFIKGCLTGRLPPSIGDYLLAEDGDYLLFEDGGKIILE